VMCQLLPHSHYGVVGDGPELTTLCGQEAGSFHTLYRIKMSQRSLPLSKILLYLICRIALVVARGRGRGPSVAFHHGQGGSSANGRSRLGGGGPHTQTYLRTYGNLPPSTSEPHMSGQGRDRREFSTVMERGIKVLSNGISFVCV